MGPGIDVRFCGAADADAPALCFDGRQSRQTGNAVSSDGDAPDRGQVSPGVVSGKDPIIFANRSSAGQALAQELLTRAESDPVYGGDRLVVALPRGGVPIAAEVARALGAPMDLVMVRKIGVPSQPELAAAAIVDGTSPVLVRNEEIIRAVGMTERELDRLAQAQLDEIERRRRVYLAGRAQEPIAGRTVIIVDDGIATGATALAAVRAIRNQRPQAVILAVPVSPGDDATALRAEVDRFVTLEEPRPFYGVGAHYRDFGQVSDGQVTRILAEAADAGQRPAEPRGN